VTPSTSPFLHTLEITDNEPSVAKLEHFIGLTFGFVSFRECLAMHSEVKDVLEK
jgi:hypothetical protein